MNLKQIEAFVKIANNQSFSQTAKEMYLTQPTVSAAIKNLEDELDIPLFVRSTRGVEMTEGAQQIYLYARQILESAAAIQRISNDASLRESAGHEILVSASTIPSQFILPEMMALFCDKYPDTQFRVSVSDSAAVVKDVEEHKADIGLCGIVPDRKHCTCIPVYRDELIIITPNTERYRTLRMNPDIDWIREEPVILREEGSGTRAEAMNYLRRAGIDPQELMVTARISNTSAILQAVRRGIGITFLSRLAAEEDLQAGHILSVPFSPEGCYRSINMIFNSAFPQTEGAKKFVRFVKLNYPVQKE